MDRGRLQVLVGVAIAASITSTAWATATFYVGLLGGPEEANWFADVSNLETFLTDQSGIELANEATVPHPLPDDTNVGPMLTFNAAATGLSRGFKIATHQPGANFWFNVPNVPHTDLLAVGDGRLNKHDDDWSLSLLDGPDLYAFAFELVENDPWGGQEDDVLKVFGPLGEEIGLLKPVMEDTGVVFVGVITDTPITGIFFDEDSGSPTGQGPDNIAIRNFHFAIPEPAAAFLLLVGAVFALRRRR